LGKSANKGKTATSVASPSLSITSIAEKTTAGAQIFRRRKGRRRRERGFFGLFEREIDVKFRFAFDLLVKGQVAVVNFED
jgi:hypothetical protein